MDELFCKNCMYFHQHYTFDKQRILRVYCGHCTVSRVKKRRPDEQACEKFSPAPPEEDAFATKEYLSKELLRYLLGLELLPEIEDAPKE